MKKLLSLRNHNSGFTVLELTITIAMTSLVFVAVIGFLTITFSQYTASSARAQLLSEAQLALDVINKDIRLSAAADDANRWPDDHAPGAPGNRFSWQSSSSVLVLATAAEDTSGDILFADPAQYISHKNNNIYFVNNNTLYKRTLAAPVANNGSKTTCPSAAATANCPADKVLLHDVTNFTIRYIDGDGIDVSPTDARSIELSVSLKSKKYGREITTEYDTRTVFRND